jgi:TonB family protein
MNWAHYILQVNIYLIVFYGFYKLLLDKETYFILNRIYLISAGILSLAIPFLRFEWFTTQPVAQPVYIGVDQVGEFMGQIVLVQDAPDKISAGSILVWLYLFGVAVFVLKFIVQLYTVRRLLKKKDSGSAFSFFSRQVVDDQLPQMQVIRRHEEIHIRQLHSADVLFFEVLGILTWFNPVIYLYKTTVKNIHEYLADEEAAKFQGDKEQYAMLLMSNALGVAPSTLINGFFNKSLLKKRIFMLYKERSRKIAILKYGLFVPLFAIALVASSATVRNNKNIKEIANDLPLEKPLAAVTEVVHKAIVAPLSQNVTGKTKKKPEAPADSSDSKTYEDWKPFYNYLMRSIRYPSAAFNAKLQGRSTVKFNITNGEVEGIGIASKPLGSKTDAEVMRAILAYGGFEAAEDGKYTITVSFTLEDAATPIVNQSPVQLNGYNALSEIVIRGYPKKDPVNKIANPLYEVVIRAKSDESGKVYDFVSLETQPSFPGGMDKFYGYVQRSVIYPKEAKDNRIEGKVFLSFVVETDGALSDIKVERKLGGGTDEEAVRVLEESPKWIPGVQNGQRVRVKYNIPISFTLASMAPGMSGRVNANGEAASITRNTQDSKVFDFISLDTQPSYPGGMEKFYQYLGKAVKYPVEAQKNNIQGKVFLSFIIEKDGTLTDIKVERKLEPSLDAEAVRIVKESSKWLPGKQDGKPVRVKYNLPISFSLTK